ncbi:MAG: XdhC family protein [Candidatus Krumholzibacteriota bacterium]|nr:XdhC family protein [Candidatus Krumholzibacteriota bacterium]
MSLAVLETLLRELEEGRTGVLVSVTAHRGSVPRKDHPRAAFLSGGRRVGTLGGGRIDGAAADMAREAFRDAPAAPRRRRLDADADEGMLCGGSVELEAEYFAPAEAARSRLAELLADPGLRSPRLLVMGGGHVGRSAASFAHAVGFAVFVLDDRAEFASEERFPFAAGRLVGSARTADEWPPPTPRDAVLLANRAHGLDLEALDWACRTEAGYIGMLGSRHKIDALLAELRQRNAPVDGLLGRFHSPVGLSIGAQTPEEIGLAVVAELVAFRRRTPPPGGANGG